jgi:hypothetical protein
VGRSVDSRQRLLADKISSWESGSILHIVPTKGRVIELEADTQFWLKKRVDTLSGVIQRIFEKDIRHKHFKGYRPVDDTFRSLLVKKALEKRITQPDGLIYFNRLLDNNKDLDFPGIYGAIAGFFSQLVGNNYEDIFANDLACRIITLEERIPGSGEERYALERDLVWLFGDYEEIKREIRVYDRDDIITNVKTFLKDGGNPSVIEGSDVILFDGFVHISRIEEDILFHLFRLMREAWWLIDYDTQSDDPVADFKKSSGREEARPWKDKGHGSGPGTDGKEAFRIFSPFVSLMDRLEDADIECRVEKAKDKAFLNPLAGGLYWNGQMEETGFDSLKIRSFGSSVDEIRAIAAEIKRIIHEDNLDVSRDLGKIRVVFPDLDDYSSLISEIFNEYGLPFSLTKGLLLSSHPISDIFIHIFKISMNHFNREDIFNLFSSDLIQVSLKQALTVHDNPIHVLAEYLLPGDSVLEVERLFSKGHEEAFSPIFDIFLFDRVIRRCGVNNLGYDLSGLEKKGLLAVKDCFYHELQWLNNADERAQLRLEYYAFIVQAHLLYKRLKPFQSLAGQDNPRGIILQFSGILDELGLPESIIDVPHRRIRPGPHTVREMIKKDLKAYSILNELISSSAKELVIADELFQIGVGHDLLSSFYSVFRHRLDRAYLLSERNPNVIRISQWLETRGRSFDYIFAGGLTADRFPLREEMNFILPESPGKIFRVQDSIDLSRHLFSHLLRNYRKCLYLSYPRYREEKALQPSQVFMDMESMANVGSSSETDSGMLETLFKWEDNPYFTSQHDMLNATVKKEVSNAKTDPTLFQLKDIILMNEESVGGIIRGINALGSRYALDGLFEYDGIVDGAALFSEFLKEKKNTFSASQLETLANCPMRYLFEYIYGLRSLREVGPEASPMDMGQYIHKILSLFFKELLDQGKNVSDMGLDWSFSKAMQIARDYAVHNPFLKRFEFFETQEKEFLAGLEQGMDDLKEGSKVREGVFARFLRFEKTAFKDRVPEGIEYQFGYNRDIVLLGKTRLRGYIDRFDMDKRDGERVYIYDYKSGIVPSSNMVKKGLSFQLPVYVRALRSVLGVKKISAAFYSLRKEVFFEEKPVKPSINDHVDEGNGLDISGVSLIDEYADQLMDNLEKGYFHHSADGLECNYCEFMYACHKDVRRMDYLLESGTGHQIYSGSKNLEKWERVDQFVKEWKDILEAMQKAFTLKTERGRKGRFESVMRFGNEMVKNRNLLPFHNEYIDELLCEIKEFEKRYLSVITDI